MLKYFKAVLQMVQAMSSRLFIVLFLFSATLAQESPATGFYKAGIRYGEAKGDSLYIKWSRAIEADTFWVYKANLSLQYITNASVRTVWYNQPLRYERRMATHHLRENIFNSPFKFSDLEGLAKNQNPVFSGKFTSW